MKWNGIAFEHAFADSQFVKSIIKNLLFFYLFTFSNAGFGLGGKPINDPTKNPFGNTSSAVAPSTSTKLN